MKKKLIPFIFGLSMLAALPLTASATDDNPEEDSGNVKYNGFASITESEIGTTPVLTAIPECTLTIPRDTTLQKGSLSANIGRVTVDGKYFVKPYYVEVSATKVDFGRTYKAGDTIPSGKSAGDRMDNPKANEDIVFDVATATGAPSTATGENHTAADEHTFVKSGTVGCDPTSKMSTFGNNAQRAARRFWKNETLSSGQDLDYKAGEICNVNGQEDIFVNIAATQWTGDNTSTETLADTKPKGGKYKGNITFTATFKDDFASNMDVWTNLS